MKIFPGKRVEFRLIDSYHETLNRLDRRTEKSENLISKYTEKSFRGTLNGNHFKLVSSAIGKGSFCVMTGAIEIDKGYVEVEINKIFRVLLSILLVFPIVGFIVIMISDLNKFSLAMVLITVVQILILRFVLIGIAFNFLSKESLNRLRDVLDLEWITD
ncbi:hypothetical protein [Pedobacter ghigonis]|uniref:hypothetical protein n=1 Tax=Pedobacter ghigonis TaxID=2730403 RepID=UPI00158F28DC|nr:hypothetical protein [Pedobacter ghigonis]